ncbi:MAG: hypothetical protein CSB55_06315 [Candidatus Cloacimonadota bacterium]|nr:MAG: hypothetical protein CSB55_06315 [Candidatus Cloacimonadota bacterium]
MKKMILSIAASDSSGGAGIHQDQRTAERLGFWCLNACTGITVQTFNGLCDILPAPDDFFEKQLRIMFDNFDISAVKTGAVCSDNQLKIIGKVLAEFKPKIVVVDPVIAPTQGKSFLSEDSSEIYKSEIFPHTSLLTPNIPELKQFFGIEYFNEEKIINVARKFDLNLYLTGGHSDNEKYIVEYSVFNNKIIKLRFKKKNWRYSHGTGCAFSTAAACFLASGKSFPEACIKSSKTVSRLFDSLQ